MAEVNEQRIRDFCALWESLWGQEDLSPMLDYLAADLEWQDIPGETRHGHEGAVKFVKAFYGKATYFRMKPRNIVAQGNLVFVERVDEMDFNGKDTRLPAVGVFEMENGKIKMWRDYFDLKMFEKQIGETT